MHGKFLQHPFIDRKIPIITGVIYILLILFLLLFDETTCSIDGELVDMSFGTGAVKVTPAHDPNDYSCGKRNNLDFIIILTEDGKIAANGGEFAGKLQFCHHDRRIDELIE